MGFGKYRRIRCWHHHQHSLVSRIDWCLTINNTHLTSYPLTDSTTVDFIIHAVYSHFPSACHGPTTSISEPRTPADVHPRSPNTTTSSRPPRAVPTSASSLQHLVHEPRPTASDSASKQQPFEQQTSTIRFQDSLSPAARLQRLPLTHLTVQHVANSLLLHHRRRLLLPFRNINSHRGSLSVSFFHPRFLSNSFINLCTNQEYIAKASRSVNDSL